MLAYIEQHVALNRRRRTASSIEVLPPSIIEHMEATHRMHRRLFYLLPIILFFAWLKCVEANATGYEGGAVPVSWRTISGEPWPVSNTGMFVLADVLFVPCLNRTIQVSLRLQTLLDDEMGGLFPKPLTRIDSGPSTLDQRLCRPC